MSSLGILDRTSVHALRRMLDQAALRQRVYAANVANAETPGYERREVEFADEMEKAALHSLRPAATHENHRGPAAADAPPFRVVEEPQEGGGSGVDVEAEMVSLAENQLRFNLAARLGALRIAGLRACIRGRP